ncbi:hypothetical protein AB838_05145 [Rhodobacteraceae bacterium (ex Bugula neritina AB1)]|nr:hypothetical protein AB838_05145 [Rhodobacteraceae bacterium (ex Bugula neritina AB1)]
MPKNAGKYPVIVANSVAADKAVTVVTDAILSGIEIGGDVCIWLDAGLVGKIICAGATRQHIPATPADQHYVRVVPPRARRTSCRLPPKTLKRFAPVQVLVEVFFAGCCGVFGKRKKNGPHHRLWKLRRLAAQAAQR